MTINLPALTDEQCLKQFGWDKNQFQIIQSTYFKGLSGDEISVFAHVCKHTRLDPFLKQIYPVMRSGKMVIQTAIDGYRLIAERTGKYCPGREPKYNYDEKGNIVSCVNYVKKLTNDGTWHEISAVAYFKEYDPGIGPFWKKMPHTMIAKCAEALALRKAFPEQLSAVYTKEEMDQADEENKYAKNLPKAECVEVKEPSVSQSELAILQDLFVQTDEDFKSKFDVHMKNMWNANDLCEIPSGAFVVAKVGMERNIEKNKSKPEVTSE